MTSNISAAPRRQSPTPLDKIVAIIAAVPLVAAETGLNAEHLAQSEGWMSTLVLGAVGATLAAAIALPIAERALARGYWLKAIGLGLFFVVMLASSFSTSVGRVGGKHDGDVAAAQGHNGRIALAKAAYESAKATREDECKRRGPLCRKAEADEKAVLAVLIAAPAAKAEDAMSKRLAAATGFSEATVALYQPLLFPLALQIGGFFFLAYGFAPASRAKEPVTIDVTPVVTETAEIVRDLKVIEKPKRVRKPKAIAYQPAAIMPKVDGRKTRGMKTKAANNNANFVPAND